MAYEQRDNSGTLFKNHRKDQPNQPDYRGPAMVNGKLVEISAWIKEGAKGKFMSLAFQPPRDRQPAQTKSAPYGESAKAAAEAGSKETAEDEVPF